jgi:hypothetical protein
VVACFGQRRYELARVYDCTASAATGDNLNSIGRGVVSSQRRQRDAFTGQTSTNWVGGTHNLVLFRGAITLSDQASPRQLLLSREERFLQRAGRLNDADDRRYMSWHDSAIGTIASPGYRTGVNFVSAVISVPTPGGGAERGEGL